MWLSLLRLPGKCSISSLIKHIIAFKITGMQVNHIDLSPNYAGTLMGITNFAANVVSIVAPLIVGVVVSDEVCITN